MERRPSDREIVAMFQNRDERAISETEKKYGWYLRSLSYGILGSESDSEECANDALMALWTHIPPEDPVSFKAYLTKTARSFALMKYRAKTSQKRVRSEYTDCAEELSEVLPDGETTESAYEHERLARLIDRFLSSLPERRRYIFTARYCMSARISEIAKELGVSETTVYSELSSIRTTLKEELQKEGFQ